MTGINDRPLAPIFVGGVDRSGTTMLGSMLGAGEGAVCTPESPFKFTLFQQVSSGRGPAEIVRELEEDVKYRQWNLGTNLPRTGSALEERFHREDEVSRTRLLLDRIVRGYAAKEGSRLGTPQEPSALRWIDHTPANLRNPVLLNRLYPEARFVHLVRDGRGVFASFKNLDWGPSTPPAAATFWLENLSYGLMAEGLWPDRVHRCRFEELVVNPEARLRELCEELDLTYRGAMARGGDFSVPRYTKHQHEAVGRPPRRDRARAWERRLSRNEVRAFEFYTNDALAMMGYEPQFDPGKDRPPPWERYGYRMRENLRHVYQTVRQYVRQKFPGGSPS